MAFFEKLIGKREEIDVEEFLNNIDVEEESSFENADAFVKPISLTTDNDLTMVLDEAKKGNIILLNISDLSKRNAIKLRDMIGQIRDGIEQIDGDIARISQDRVLITPSKVKIVKRRENA